MPTHNTKWYRSTMTGAAALSGQAGKLIDVLDACLVNGFNQVTLTSLVVASNVATCTYTAHGFQQYQIIEIAGATPAGLNGKWRVVSAAADTFTFATTGISDQTATGTITCKTPSAGWEVTFSGTNQKVYRSTSSSASGNHAVRVTDTGTTTATLLFAEDWTDVSTPVNTIATQYLPKSSTADSTARPWFVICDDRTVHLGIAFTSGRYDFFRFGEIASIVPGDGHAYEARCARAASVASLGFGTTCGHAALINATNGYGYFSRPYSQVVGPIPCFQITAFGAWGASFENATSFYNYDTGSSVSKTINLSASRGWVQTGTTIVYSSTWGLFTAPNPGDGGLHFTPVLLIEGPSGTIKLRGTVRGLLHILEDRPLSSDVQFLSGIEGVSSGLLAAFRSQNETLAQNTGTYVYPETHFAFDLSDWA